MSKVKVALFTDGMEPLGEYYTTVVPREGEHLTWDDELYEVSTVTWEGLPEMPTAQVRVQQ